LGDSLVARVDRKAGRLVVRSMHFEPGAPSNSGEALEEQLARMAQWLGLEGWTTATM
jgi:uncharacterized protein YcaQ